MCFKRRERYDRRVKDNFFQLPPQTIWRISDSPMIFFLCVFCVLGVEKNPSLLSAYPAKLERA